MILVCIQFTLRWNEAKYWCRLSNYTLVSVQTKEKDDLIHNHLMQPGGNIINKFNNACIY